MNFIYVIHLLCWNYLIDLSTDNRNRNCKNRSELGVAQVRALHVTCVQAVRGVAATADGLPGRGVP